MKLKKEHKGWRSTFNVQRFTLRCKNKDRRCNQNYKRRFVTAVTCDVTITEAKFKLPWVSLLLSRTKPQRIAPILDTPTASKITRRIPIALARRQKSRPLTQFPWCGPFVTHRRFLVLPPSKTKKEPGFNKDIPNGKQAPARIKGLPFSLLCHHRLLSHILAHDNGERLRLRRRRGTDPASDAVDSATFAGESCRCQPMGYPPTLQRQQPSYGVFQDESHDSHWT